MFKLPNYQKGVIVGLLLSDGLLSYASANNKYPRFGKFLSFFFYSFINSLKKNPKHEKAYSQSSYVWSVFAIFSRYCYSLPRFKTKIEILYKLVLSLLLLVVCLV